MRIKIFYKKIKFLINNKILLKTIFNRISEKTLINFDFLRQKPEFLIIGAAKSGTTYAFNLLKQHPDLELPKEKEINYFDYNYFKGDKWYTYKFPFLNKKRKITGEASPCYLYHPLAPERAFRFNPNFKIIIFLRNPVYRALSNYFMKMNHYNFEFQPERLLYIDQELKLSEIYEKNIILDDRSSFRILRDFSFVRRGIYLFQIKRWQNFFPAKNFLIIKSEDFYENTEQILSQICEFLNIDKNFDFKLTVDKYQGNYKNKIDEMIIYELKKFYKSHNEELESFLNRKFNWE